jgi:chitin deacetylase
LFLQGSSDLLYDFLKTQNQRATHFFIGVNIIYNIPQFNTAYETLQDDIAVHTWTHPYMTVRNFPMNPHYTNDTELIPQSLSNEDVVAQLGYTMQAIRDLTGGRLPAYWRPPFGDSDARVSAIAKEVFGMTTIIWNQEYVYC